MSMPIAWMGGSGTMVPQETRKQENQEQRASQSRDAVRARFAASLPGTGEKNAAAAIARLEKISLSFNRRLQYVVNHDSNQITVKVIDGNTDKVIKVLPPEELQRLSEGVVENLGAIFDEKI